MEMHQFLYRTGQLHLQLKNFVHLRAYLFCMMEKRLRYQKETAMVAETSGIYLGNDNNLHEIMIPEKMLVKHMFVCGVPGSGKTNTMLHLANSLWKKKYLFLF